jgi:hypothetical protein
MEAESLAQRDAEVKQRTRERSPQAAQEKPRAGAGSHSRAMSHAFSDAAGIDRRTMTEARLRQTSDDTRDRSD